jgi:hypothetical protein
MISAPFRGQAASRLGDRREPIVFIDAAMSVVMATIGLFGPSTTNPALEKTAG